MSTFVLNRNYKLQLPTSYVEVDREEMEYVDGGDYALPVFRELLTKSICTNEAYYIAKYFVKGMSVSAIAKEIFAHAVAYYSSEKLSYIPGASKINAHAGVVNISDGGDSLAPIYSLVWTLIPG